MRPVGQSASLFTRRKNPEDFNLGEVFPVVSSSHSVRRARKKTKSQKAFVVKGLSPKIENDPAMEVYSAWVFRLHILQGNSIPKYSLCDDGSVISEEVTGFRSADDICRSHWGSYSYLDVLRAKILDNKKSNLRALAQILVCSVVFAEHDLKTSHIVFDKDNNLTRIDFDCTFWKGLSFDLSDLESLPMASESGVFRPHNFIFNRSNGKVNTFYCSDGKQFSSKLGPGFKRLVYGAILKILLMPDFLLKEISGIINHAPTSKKDLGEHDYELCPQKKIKLLKCMMNSLGFKEFLVDQGEVNRALILSEILSIRKHNSFFRKKFTEEDFGSHCAESIDRAYFELKKQMDPPSGDKTEEADLVDAPLPSFYG